MRIEFSFDKNKVEQSGYALETVNHTIRKNFEAKGLQCIENQPVLAFSDIGNEGDFSNMWTIIMALLRTEWFPQFATSCIWYDDDGIQEDVLSQAWKVQKNIHKTGQG